MAATLMANNGDWEIAFEFLQSSEYAHDTGFESTILWRGQHWDGDHTFPTTGSMEGMWLCKDDLRMLLDHVHRWVEGDIRKLRADGLTAKFDLARLPGQKVSIVFGSREDSVQSLNPVVTILLSAGVFQTEFHFATDQSCLRLWTDALSRDIEQYANKPNQSPEPTSKLASGRDSP